MLVRSFPMKSRKRLVRDVFVTVAALAGLVQGVTGTDCWAQNSCARVYVFAAFKGRFTTNGNRNREEKLLSVLHSISTDGPRHLLLRRGSSLERLFYPLQSKKKVVLVVVRVFSLFLRWCLYKNWGLAT